MWKDLTQDQKAEVMDLYLSKGITSLSQIRDFYDNALQGNRFDDGGYVKWKQKASKYKNLDIDNDITYDYEGWYNENPKRAWDFLNDSPNAHFTDNYKTVYHPTFSTQSKYSGKVNSKFNPNGLIGGTWSKDNYTFIMSPDGYKGPVSMDERKAYLEDAEDNGVQLREADGTLPIYDNDIWGGVLPTVVINRNKFGDGGKIYIKPENRGKFTALKERTGHSSTWFKEHGTPAQKKMATFALNARKWNHAYGGKIYIGDLGQTALY